MDIREIAERHPELLTAVLAKATGVLGEILVAEALRQRGFVVRPVNNNSPQFDLDVTSPAGTTFGVEVKADRARRPTWFVRKRPSIEASQFWFFVSAPREPDQLPDPALVQMFILTSMETREIWDNSDWNKRNPTNGDVRRWQIPDDALNAWHKLPE